MVSELLVKNLLQHIAEEGERCPDVCIEQGFAQAP